MTEIAIILGTRPEIIKLSPVIRECEERGIEYTVIHTGQHYSDNLDTVFFERLELPKPDYNLSVGSKSHGKQTSEMLADIEEILLDIDADIVLVQGDTNSVLAGAIATSKLDADLGHIEAGLRSFNREMPEETNRVVTDHVADYLFAPTEQSAEYLREEGLPDERIIVTGNTVVDALYRNQKIAEEKSSILREFDIIDEDYFLMTAHRAENVDNSDSFEEILSGVSIAANRENVIVIYPIHPRAENKLEEFGISVPPGIRLVEPQDYLGFLKLQANAKLVLTDSGGVQEEACILGVPCVTIRENTERPETVSVGANQLSGIDAEGIADSVECMLKTDIDWDNPFGDGTAGSRIIEEFITTSAEVKQ
ncbi:UDP-N-acetylglucosamine 2-epimerase (non-hydrolyzing) [Halorubrum ezzemoulense]|uniref:non-hydrolyzing UDP-N-acetylglucosamine 2-epimerase n=1 Tax=Halorubrum ezzemoulense TaxID=337243 RepID=UPI00232BF03C|nr:UDP-N-acetylglucosamine 2-epimerase (non-hydrolyzing) [Halorubrum ezzemoulense]MDB2252497.1 UDP-N-acetylglucosamine 2-epimerase (non-hydrolyzing) [Halorubrum ezzemoulense]